MATDAPKPCGDDWTAAEPDQSPDDRGLSSGEGGQAERPGGPFSPGWRWLVGATLFYLLALTVATWPAIPKMASELPSRVDPLAHLWTMRWNKSCLLAGKLPFYCPEIQYPVGAALGTLPPMHFQTLLYVPLSFAFANDILCYNIIRTAAFLLTGVGTLILIWNVLRDRWVATVGGMLAMLGQPMIFFSQGELEQITVGWFPIFLVAWLRWVDRPTGRGLAFATLSYLLVAMSAPYFGVFAVFPASLYVAWRWVAAGRAGEGFRWLRARLAWFASFGALTAPVMILLFSNQIWAIRHGFSLTRPDSEFFICRVPLWSYLVPSPNHELSRFLPFSTYVMGEVGAIPSYLGVVTLGLIAYAAVARVPFARRAYWWAVFALLVTLSLGAHAWVFGHDISMPAAWLKKYFIGFRMIRVPARFCLFAGVGAALVAAAGLLHLLRRIKSTPVRRVVLGSLTAAALLDLTVAPYPTVAIPPLPPCYAFIRAQDPHATIADVPHFNDGAFNLPSLVTYWQSLHHLTTTAGYTAFNNTQQDNLMAYNSPFEARRLADPEYLEHWYSEHFELADRMDFQSYVWLYLTVHKIRYVVFHTNPKAFPEMPIHPERAITLLREAQVYEDDQNIVFDRDRLPRPTLPVFVYDQGWGHRVARREESIVMLHRTARVWAYNPFPNLPLTFTLDVAGHKTVKTVILKADGRELTRWTVPPTEIELFAAPPFKLAAGLHELTIISDSDDKPSRTDAHIANDRTPFSLWLAGVSFGPATWESLAGRHLGDRVLR